MSNINEINTAVYKVLNNDVSLGGLCTVYKGKKRPIGAENPSVTVNATRLEPGKGEGVWMCDVVVSSYVDILANRMPDHDTHSQLNVVISNLLTDTEIDLDSAKALPLIRGESTGPEWDRAHDNETLQETTFGLVFVKFS